MVVSLRLRTMFFLFMGFLALQGCSSTPTEEEASSAQGKVVEVAVQSETTKKTDEVKKSAEAKMAEEVRIAEQSRYLDAGEVKVEPACLEENMGHVKESTWQNNPSVVCVSN